MPEPVRQQFPATALAHLIGDDHVVGSGARVLTVDAPASLPGTIAAQGHQVFVVHRDIAQTAALAGHSRLTPVAAAAEALPFDPCQFDVVVAHQAFHEFQQPRALAETARVLRPGGHLSISYLSRDDSVPWVRRLVAIVQSVDPDAMRGQYGTESVQHLVSSKYFPRHDEKSFRIWVPVSQDALLRMIAALPAVSSLDEGSRNGVIDQVRGLHADIARGASALQLPYLLTVWRGYVDHEELTAPIAASHDALVISI